MKGKIAFVMGAAVGYVLGTQAGREQFDRLKGATKEMWQNPKVQEKVSAAEEKVGAVVREQGAQVTDRVASVVKERLHDVSGSGSGAGEGSEDTGGPGGPGESSGSTPR